MSEAEYFLFEFKPASTHEFCLCAHDIASTKIWDKVVELDHSSKRSVGKSTQTIKDALALMLSLIGHTRPQLLEVPYCINNTFGTAYIFNSQAEEYKERDKAFIGRIFRAFDMILAPKRTEQSRKDQETQTMPPSAPTAPKQRCDQCIKYLGSNYCANCAFELKNLVPEQKDIIELIRAKIIAAGAGARDCRCKGAQCHVISYNNGKTCYGFEKPNNFAKFNMPGYFRLWETLCAIEAKIGRKFQIGATMDSSSNAEYIGLPKDNESLKALQAQLTEPIFIYGAKCEVIFTKTELEGILRGLVRHRDYYGDWFHPVLAIDPAYPNICCLICVISVYGHYVIN